MSQPPPSDPAPPPAPAAAPKKGLAIATLALGLLGFCAGAITGIPAIICGVVATSRISRNPLQYGGKAMAITGMILGFVTSVLMVLIGVSGQAQAKARTIKCVNNLKNLSWAARAYATNNDGRYPKKFAEMQTDLSPKALLCPDDKNKAEHQTWASFNDADSSYEFLTPAAAEADVSDKQTFRCAIHGSYALGNGSVVHGKP